MQLFPTIIGAIIYRISLIGCHEPLAVCLEKYSIAIIKYVILIIVASAFFFFLQILFYFQKKNNTKQFLTTLATMFLCFIYDSGSEFNYHGSYNRIILCIFFVLFFIFYWFYLLFVKLFRKFPFPFVFISVGIAAFTNYRLKSIFSNSCHNWSQGFHDTVIDNSTGNCKIYPPKTCYFEIFHGVFDFSAIFGVTCENTPYNDPSNILDYITDKKAKFIGFPRTEKFNFFPESQYKILQHNVAKNIINMEDPNISDDVKKEVEVTINFHKNPAEINIDLKVNHTLIEERTDIFEDFKHDVLSKNVLFIFIDSLSRTNFRRKLPKFYKWIESKHHL